MADVFSSQDARGLLKNKRLFFLGDSNTRAQYKDLVWLLNFNTLIDRVSLRSKLELSYLGDCLVKRSPLNYGRDFQEVRKYCNRANNISVEFMFLTRCFNNHIQQLFCNFKNKSKPIPDVIVINSCLWDLTRWGPNGVQEYKDNMVKLLRTMVKSLPPECLVIWTTTLPTAAHVRGGLLIKQIEFMEPLLRFEVMEANTFAREIVVSHGFDVLDNHYHTRMQMHRRAKDGVHYMPIPVRLMTNLLLTHIALTWGTELPKNINSMLINKAIFLDSKTVKKPMVKLPNVGIFSKINLSSPVPSRTRGLKITVDNVEGATQRRCSLLPIDTEDPCSLQQVDLKGVSPNSLERFHMPNNLNIHENNVHSFLFEEPITDHFQGPYRRRDGKNRNRRRPYY